VNQTDALNLWDIEVRIRELQHELEHLHNEKSKLLGEKYKDGIAFTCE